MKKSLKLGVFVVLSLLVLSFLVGVGSAGPITDGIKDGLKKAVGGSTGSLSDDTKATISKILLMVLVVMIVYSISSFLPFVPEGKDHINWIIAIIVSILAFLYVTPESISSIVVSYQALGIALTGILPLIILLTFTYQLHEKNKLIASVVNPIIIVFFIGYCIVQWYLAADAGSDLAFIFLITMLIGFIWLFFGNRIFRIIFKKKIRLDAQKISRSEIASLEARLAQKEQELTALRSSGKAASKESISNLQEEIKSIQDGLHNYD